MIRRDEHAPFAMLRQRLQERADHMAIDLLQRRHLGVGPAFVGRLIGSLDMHADGVDALFDASDDLTALFNLEVFLAAKLAMCLAVFIWWVCASAFPTRASPRC